MDNRSFLHDGETLLVHLHPAGSVYVVDFFKGLIEGLVVGVIVVFPVWYFAMLAPMLAYAAITLACALMIYRRMRHLQHSSFRVTTERILILHHHGFFREPLKTIRWDQYQESLVDNRSVLDAFFGARPISIRYGNADSKDFRRFPAVSFAEDLKHYLDKAYSLIKAGNVAELKPFVLKKRGKRDE